VVYLGQVASNLIPMYMEPDMPWNVASIIFLPRMSFAMGGSPGGTGDAALLHEDLIGMEMPAYRYLKEVDLPTYDIHHSLPLVNRGAVPRFFDYPTLEDIADVRKACGEGFIRVYNYDFQVHAGTDALVNGRFNITLPTNGNTKGYLIQKKDGTYEPLVPHSKTTGWNVATVIVADHGRVPFTVDLDDTGRPIVAADGRAIEKTLPVWDNLIGIRIVEIFINPILGVFKGGVLPPNFKETEGGLEYTVIINDKGSLLSNSMLDGWRIIRVTPNSSKNWKAAIVNGEIVITITCDTVFDETVTVTLQKDGTTETMDIEITFSGEKEGGFGCNAGTAMLALLAICPVFIRRRY